MSDEQPDSVERQALQWYVDNRDATVGLAQRDAFMAWLKHSPEHVKAYLAISVVSQDVAAVAGRLPGVPPAASAGKVVMLEGWRGRGTGAHAAPAAQPLAPRRRTGARRRALRAVVAASVMLAAGLWHAWPQTEQLSTGVAEQRSMVLGDGTVLHLGADSAARVRLGWLRREIWLDRGRAAFVVAPDRRSFQVLAAGLQVNDIGTTFDVRLSPSRTRVAVSEGRVQVRRGDIAGAEALLADLGAGEMVDVQREGSQVHRSTLESAAMLDWLDGWVVFSNERLEDVVAEFNRFHGGRIRIADARAAGLRYSGRLRSHDLHDFLEFAEREPSLRLSRVGGDIVIHAR